VASIYSVSTLFIWLCLTYYTFQVMMERKFESEGGIRVNKPYFMCLRTHRLFSCLLGWFFQDEGRAEI
jgi:uncharacterized membrane protein YozB (DUF420 family)